MNKLEQLSQAIVNLPDDLALLRTTLMRLVQEGDLLGARLVIVGAYCIALCRVQDGSLLDQLDLIQGLLK